MIPIGAFIEVVDNSGAQEVQVIGLLKKFRKRYGEMKDIFVVVLKKLHRNTLMLKRKVKKGGMHHAMLIKVNVSIRRFGGSHLKGFSNGMVLLTRELEVIARRINSYVFFNFRERGLMRLITVVETIY